MNVALVFTCPRRALPIPLSLMLITLLPFPCSGVTDGASPLFITHFFDWYSPSTPPEQFTHRIEWEKFDLTQADVGATPRYYAQQFHAIEATGFDGIVYEWYGIQPKPMVCEQLLETGLDIGIFYDLAIRYHLQPPLQPTEQDAARLTSDVTGFYDLLPPERMLVDSQDRLVMVFYAFPFDLSNRDPDAWNLFFTRLAEGLEEALGKPIRVYWTGLHNIQAMHGLLHFEQFSPLNFNPFEAQTQIDADSVCWAFNYDDRGAVVQGRKDRLIQKDPGYLQEGFDLALRTTPNLVFNYGWNEYFEGENIMPDATYGDYRQKTLRNMITALKAYQPSETRPRAVVIVDDLLARWSQSDGSPDPWIENQFRILYTVRRFLPQADVRISGELTFESLSNYDIIVGLNRHKIATEDRWLADLAPIKKILYFQPATRPATGMTELFTSAPRTSLLGDAAGLSPNEFVIARTSLHADLAACPILSFRVRNTPGSLFHIRLTGVDTNGNEHAAWVEESELDDQSTGGSWEERRVHAGSIALQAAGVPIIHVTSIDIILDDEENGAHSLDLDYLRFESESGDTTSWHTEFDSLHGWLLFAGENVPPSDRTFTSVSEEEVRYAQIAFLADNPKLLEATVGEETGVLLQGGDHVQRIIPAPGVQTRATITFEGEVFPLLLTHDDDAWINHYNDDGDRLWEEVFRLWTGRTGNPAARYGVFNAVLMRDYLNAGEVKRIEDIRWSRIRPEPLPISPQPPMPIAGFHPRTLTVTDGSEVLVKWTAGGLDSDGSIAHFERALDPVIDGKPGGSFQPVEVEALDRFGGGQLHLPRPQDGDYEIWIRTVDETGVPGFLQEPFLLKVDTEPPPKPHSLRLIQRDEHRIQITGVFPEDPISGLAGLNYALGPSDKDPAQLTWEPLLSWNAAVPALSQGNLWIQDPIYHDGRWSPDTTSGLTAIRPEEYLYVFWDDSFYNQQMLDLFLLLWTPQTNRLAIWYVERPGGAEFFRFTQPVPISLRNEWCWARLPVPAHSGDGNGADLARLQEFDTGLKIAGMTARLQNGTVRFAIPPPPGPTGIWVKSIDAAGWSSQPGFLSLTQAPAAWSLY